MKPLPRWASRAAAIVLLVAVVGIVVIGGVLPLLAYSARLSEQVDQNRALIARLEQLTASRTAFEDQLRDLTTRQAETDLFLSGSSEGVAAAEMQQLVKAVIEDWGGVLRSTQSLPAEPDGDFRRITVGVVLDSSVAALADILADLESRTPYVFVDNFMVQTQRTGSEGDLLARFDLYGYLERQAE